MTTVYLTTGGGLLFAVLLAAGLWLVFGRSPRTAPHVVLVRQRDLPRTVPMIVPCPSYGAAVAKKAELLATEGGFGFDITIEPAGGAR